MPEPLKNMFSPAFFESLCPVLKEVLPGFHEQTFIHRIFNTDWPQLELKQRVRHITHALHNSMDCDYPEASQYIVAIANRIRQSDDSQLHGFACIFLPDYLGLYGVDYFDESLAAMEEVTKLVSAEFAIRPFLLRYPERTLKHMLRWSRHKDAHVRRLASEGCRPRLPWGMGVPALKKDPAPILPILENLKTDSSESVRKSVANNLNDIAKDHPERVLTIARKWQGQNPQTDWIIKHGCRTLLKRGHVDALGLHGYSPDQKAQIKNLVLSPRVRIGEYLEWSFTFINKESVETGFRLEYAIDYRTASGKISRRVFKITEKNFSPGEKYAFQRRQSFKDFTTRKHFKGAHNISIVVNGKPHATAGFMVVNGA